ncbi:MULTISPECIES: MFS transporter [Phaeobacter]|uniref:Major facilitator superfamily (MFS), general substrate transporter n=1 Tax=Phaeobacter inhibens TaxID=221822 RepID=A0A2I7JRT5_9RHOB|nr:MULTISPECIES: MFS transporter [Phaeobacter]AUQ48578.1 major facilitator superfamily (MFS), general substrate transporter [Phaeobacter inhibens]AUQ93078.1 major facilitator superfamily (MFS), general substrate transporter [Phaeobacter inhibens]AUR00448.1 major facilitator superfamily (MFS), general substrate transporter [Phaeobacter inhibens]AUR18381.1 major facilitator superfamily (MFS), general substrate transporter [Phaeobacter inhibens]MBQ4808118.1 MFS transporter [Phaeobacter sp. HS012]
MVRSLLPLSALLMGSAFLLFAGGVNGLILPIRGEAEGFTAASLGLLGTGWAVGYVAGCMRTPALVARVGHIRAFGAMCAIAAIAVLLSLVLITPWVWIPVRALSGFCFAGAAMIVESWLNERADASSRGRIFGIYTMVNLAATTAGQMVLTLGDSNGYFFFVLAAMVYCLALLPTAISATTTPRPLTQVSLDLRGLWKNSPIAVFAVLMVGVSNAAFGTLAAVYAARIQLELDDIAFFASIPILAGAAMQIPVGIASDKFDRRKVLIGVTVFALLADALFLFTGATQPLVVLALSALFGATVFSMYPVIVAHANDHAEPGTFIQVSGGLLLVFGIGSIVGPTVAGFAMTSFGATSLFAITGVAHILLVLFALLRLKIAPPVTAENKALFQAKPLARGSTPETAALAADQSELDADQPSQKPTSTPPAENDPKE